MSGSEITRLLGLTKVPDVNPSASKRDRLAAALLERQYHDRTSNRLVTFVTQAMAPARYLNDPTRFDLLQQGLNEALSLVGLRVTDEGRLGRAAQAKTLDEVAALAGRLRGELVRRAVHDQVVSYCQEELLRRSIFHAVFEATKGLAERLRQMSRNPALDGAELVDACFGAKQGTPVIRINGYTTKSEVSEHQGFANLLKGIFGTFRNPTAHVPRTAWTVSEPDALDLFSTLSFLHRRLDGATVTP